MAIIISGVERSGEPLEQYLNYYVKYHEEAIWMHFYFSKLHFSAEVHFYFLMMHYNTNDRFVHEGMWYVGFQFS